MVADPFSGGGTVALEAARRGLPVYAQDIHPWAVAGLATALDGINPDVLVKGAATALARLEPLRLSLYGTSCPSHGDNSELVHVFWARWSRCPACSEIVYLYPYSLLTLASRALHESEGYFGCRSCGGISRHAITASRRRRCHSCDSYLSEPDTPLLANRMAKCCRSSCRNTFPVFDGEAPRWVVVLVQRLCRHEGRSVVHFDRPTDRELAGNRPVVSIPKPLVQRIPAGIETSILHRAGFKRWCDLYPPRQLATLLAAADIIESLDVSEPTKTRLRLAVSGSAEMAGFASRWDRYYPKAFEAIANHRFAALGFACETNLLATQGRGTIRRRFASSVHAARFARAHLTVEGGTRVRAASGRRTRLKSGALLGCGSSERQLTSDGSVDLVLTDPPYFDSVQYAELASLFLAWAHSLNLVPSSLTLDLRSEAVANSSRGAGVEEYRALLTRIFRETKRALKVDGQLVLTFHNTDIRAWWALARALDSSGFAVVAIAVAQAENATDHPKRNRRSFTKDLVIECRQKFAKARLTVVEGGSDTQGRELRAVGRAVASGGGLDIVRFRQLFLAKRGDLKSPRIRVAGDKAS